MKAFLVGILILSLLIPAAYGINIDDKDWAALQTSYTQYKANYNRVMVQRSIETNAANTEVRALNKLVSVWSNQWQTEHREKIEARTEKNIYLIILGAITALATYGLVKGAVK